MSDIFISYASEDRDTARKLAAALEAHGWSVWWDRTIPAGRTFVEVIDEAMSKARCVVVAWSATSIKKNWVLEEAQDGLDRGILVPVFIEQVTPPRGFRRIQAADLSAWDGSIDAPAFRHFVNDLTGILGPPPQGAADKTPVMPREPTGDARKEARQPAPAAGAEKARPEERAIPRETAAAKPDESGAQSKPSGKVRKGRGIRLFFFAIVLVAAALSIMIVVERPKPDRVVSRAPRTPSVAPAQAPPPPAPRPTAPASDATTAQSRAWLGVQTAEVTQEVAAKMSLDMPRGAMVVRIVPETPAASAGLRVGDVILELNRQKIERQLDLARLVSTLPPGTTVLLLIRRDKQSLFVTATLTAIKK